MISDVECFSWRIAVSDMSSKQKMASLMFGFNRKQFVCLWSREDDYIGLGMVTGVISNHYLFKVWLNTPILH